MLKILMIKGHTPLSHACRWILMGLGHEVTVAQDEAEAWERLSVSPSEIVIVDAPARGANGFELGRKMRSNGIFTPILLMQTEGTPKGLWCLRWLDDNLPVEPFPLQPLMSHIENVLVPLKNDPQASGGSRTVEQSANLC